MKNIASVFAALIALTVAFHAEPQNPAGRAGQGDVSTLTRRVVLVTIDGMRGDYLGNADAYQLRIPNLRRLMHEGSYSPRTLSVFPTLTGTAHTALVTGTGAMKHGILGNNKFDPTTWVYRDDNPDNYDLQPAFRDYADIRAVARRRRQANRRSVHREGELEVRVALTRA